MDIVYKSVYSDKTVNTRKKFEILFSENEELQKPWCIQYCGAGHYFRKLYGTLCYAYGRGFIDESMIDSVSDEVLRNLPEDYIRRSVNRFTKEKGK